jgi:hypothetical protein
VTPLQLVQNPWCVALKASSVHVAYYMALLGILVHALPFAPPWISGHLPVQALIDTWNWGSGVATAMGVQGARIVQQPSLTPGG